MRRIRRCMEALTLSWLIVGVPTGAVEPPADLAVGIERFEAGDLDGARRFFESSGQGFDQAWADYFLGRIHLREGEVEEAIESLSSGSPCKR